MKLSLVFLVAVCWVASATVPYLQVVEGNKDYLMKQKHIIELFDHVNQVSYLPHHVKIADSFHIREHVNDYTHSEVVHEFLEMYENDMMLGRDEIFSINHKPHMEQAVALFKLFYYAKDYDTYYKTAIWARQHMNPTMFVYSLSVAHVHRDDTKKVMLPPIYEILPHHFFNTETINRAVHYKQTDKKMKSNDSTFESRYSGWYMNLHPEQSMSYYMEDIDVNAHQYYHHIHFPFWMDTDIITVDEHLRGELYLIHMQQNMARYYLERIAHGCGEVTPIDWHVPLDVSYTPSMTYHNGLPFPSRPNFAQLYDYYRHYGGKVSHGNYTYSYEALNDYSRRIHDAIDSGFVRKHNGEMVPIHSHEGFGILGNIIQHNTHSVNQHFYGPLEQISRHILGYSPEPLDDHKLVPSVLEHYETAMRDPVYYKFLQNIMIYYMKFMARMKPYTKEELEFPEVEIKEAHVDPLITYLNHFHSSLNNAIYYGPEEESRDIHLLVKQQRVNHKPFTYKLKVKAGKPQKAVVKMFLGPKYDEYGRHANISEHHLYYVEMDRVVVDLKAGDNMIERSSHEFAHYAPDRKSTFKLYDDVEKSLKSGFVFNVDHRQNYMLKPNRLMLPKGTIEGTAYRMFFVVHPFHPRTATHEKHTMKRETEHHHKEGHHNLHEHIIIDEKSIIYPFDRFIKFEKMFENIPNFHSEDVIVYFKDIFNVVDEHQDHHHTHDD